MDKFKIDMMRARAKRTGSYEIPGLTVTDEDKMIAKAFDGPIYKLDWSKQKDKTWCFEAKLSANMRFVK